MNPAMQSIAVVGAGVIGLTTGIRLLESGFKTHIFARDITEKMASRAAPAYWDPYKAGPEASILKWAAFSLNVYQHIDPVSGVRPIDVVEMFHADAEAPLWTKLIKYRELEKHELTHHYVRGYATHSYLIDTSIYLDYLKQRFEKLGGVIQQQAFLALTEVDKVFNAIINCSGVGSFALVPDQLCFPIRGQYLLLEKIPALSKLCMWTLDDDNYVLIVPRANDCWIGGTTVIGDWDTEINLELSKRLLRRAQDYEPLLKDAKIKHAGVGLRPGRAAVRVEKEILADKRTVIHNYGHGGSGFTVSWGCAEDVLELLGNV